MISVLFKDEHIIAVDKPSGMIVHRGWGRDSSTVADIVRDNICGQPVHAVHRLDRGTSGVLLFALDPSTCAQLQEQLNRREMEKRYLAVVRGTFKEERLLDHPIKKRGSDTRHEAITLFKPLSSRGRFSLVEACPRTGRQHQIRRHLKHLSHPIAGDVRFGKGDINRLLRDSYHFDRLALHAHRLSFKHPIRGAMTIDAPVPSDLAELVRALELDEDLISQEIKSLF